MAKKQRVIGTTIEAITKAELEIGWNFSPSFRDWLLAYNGLSLEDVGMFPVFDERDVRKTWDSIAKRYNKGQWLPDYLEDEAVVSAHLLPFATSGSGDYYCFDYNRQREDGETPIVFMEHDEGKCEDEAETFAEFVVKVKFNEQN